MIQATLRDTTDSTRIEEIRRLYDQGLYLQAWRLGEPFGAPQEWPGIEGQLLAARLVGQLGSARRREWLLRGVLRRHPDSLDARYYYAYGLLTRRGPYHARQWIRQLSEPSSDTTSDALAAWYAFQGQIASVFRDFDEAEGWLQRARDAAPESPWVLTCVASVLQSEDRYAEALETAQQAIALQPAYRPAVQEAAHLLTLLNRDEEALELLVSTVAATESSGLAAQLYAVRLELRQYVEAGEALDKIEAFSPLMERPYRKWLAAQRSEVAYYLGDMDAAIQMAELSDSAYHKAIAERLKDPARAEGRSVLLPVKFVRQHHVTCAPATLSAISQYWRKPAEHLQVADAICYNGTHCYSERKWARDNGWVTREFSVTEESAAELLDRGIPFTFTTNEPTDSHLQAIIGYDSRRGTLHLRDPYLRNVSEGLSDKLLERYRAHGPRGMALVPEEAAEKLEGIELPDAPLWDLLHEIDGALQEHRRDDAMRALDQLLAAAPDHRLALDARIRLAVYDGNPAEHLASIEKLLEMYPDEPRLQLVRLGLMRHQANPAERLATYARMCDSKTAHPVFWQQYAQELRADARRHDEAIDLLLRAIRRWPTEGSNYYILANIYWDQRRFEPSLDLYRLAVCLDDKDEQFAASYFNAAASLKRTDEALHVLRSRFARYGGKSSYPARTLAAAYIQLDRENEAIEVVEQALLLRGEDGDLMLFAAGIYLGCSQEHLPQARRLVEMARERAPRVEYLRVAARLASSEGRLADSLALWREAVELQPMNVEGHARVAQLLAETESQSAALDHLAQAAERFPHYYPLHELRMEWLRDEPFSVREPAMRKLLETMPDHAWAHREWALWLASERRFGEAEHAASEAMRLDPTNVSSYLVRAQLHEQQGRIDEARADLRHAIELSVDCDTAIGRSMELCSTAAERRETLRFVKEQLVAQVIFGDGLLVFREYAQDTLEPDELLAVLRDALAERPDLWHAWSAVMGQLVAMQQLDEAWQLAQQATERFPLLPRVWFDRAEVCRARLDPEGEQLSLETAYRINPGWTLVARELAEFYERRGDFDRARQLLERASARAPLDPGLHLALAEFLWNRGDREGAIARAERVVQIEPGYNRAWGALDDWGNACEQPERALRAARELVQRRSGEARSWLILARLLDAPEQSEERLAAIHRALELNPRAIQAHDQLAIARAHLERYDEAVAACGPAVFGPQAPVELRIRRAWVEAMRGNLDGAVEQMRVVLAEEPHQFSGWSLLADWLKALDDLPGYLEANEALVRIAPHSPFSWGCLGDALQALERGDEATVAFRRAFELDPHYEFAGNCLFDAQLEKGDVAGAAETLHRVRLYSDSAFVLAREAQLAAKQGDSTTVLDRLETLCTKSAESGWPLLAACEGAKELGLEARAAELLGSALGKPDAIEPVGDLWFKYSQDQQAHGVTAWLDRLAPHLEALAGQTSAARRATYNLLEEWAKGNQTGKVRQFINRNTPWLRAHDELWGAASYALTATRDWDASAAWSADWRDRAGAMPWMLVNASEAFLSLNRIDEGLACSLHAVEMPPDNGTRLHHVLLATEAAVRGDLDRAEAHFAEVSDTASLPPDYQFPAELTQALLEVGRAPSRGVGKAAWRAIGRIRRARDAYERFLPFEPSRRRYLRLAMHQLAKLAGRWWVWLWYYGKRAGL